MAQPPIILRQIWKKYRLESKSSAPSLIAELDKDDNFVFVDVAANLVWQFVRRNQQYISLWEGKTKGKELILDMFGLDKLYDPSQDSHRDIGFRINLNNPAHISRLKNLTSSKCLTRISITNLMTELVSKKIRDDFADETLISEYQKILPKDKLQLKPYAVESLLKIAFVAEMNPKSIGRIAAKNLTRILGDEVLFNIAGDKTKFTRNPSIRDKEGKEFFQAGNFKNWKQKGVALSANAPFCFLRF